MSEERSLSLRGHVDIRELSSIISASIDGKSVETSVQAGCAGVTQYFRFTFRDSSVRMDRLIRCHHGLESDNPRFRGEDYTFLVTGAFGATDRILKRIGEIFGGDYKDDLTNEEISFPFPEESMAAKP